MKASAFIHIDEGIVLVEPAEQSLIIMLSKDSFP